MSYCGPGVVGQRTAVDVALRVRYVALCVRYVDDRQPLKRGTSVIKDGGPPWNIRKDGITETDTELALPRHVLKITWRQRSMRPKALFMHDRILSQLVILIALAHFKANRIRRHGCRYAGVVGDAVVRGWNVIRTTDGATFFG